MSLDDVANKAVAEGMELYFRAHPSSPSAVRRPQLLAQRRNWIALLGYNAQDGIVAFGKNVEDALRAFDAQYLESLQPPNGVSKATQTQMHVAAPFRIRLFRTLLFFGNVKALARA